MFRSNCAPTRESATIFVISRLASLIPSLNYLPIRLVVYSYCSLQNQPWPLKCNRSSSSSSPSSCLLWLSSSTDPTATSMLPSPSSSASSSSCLPSSTPSGTASSELRLPLNIRLPIEAFTPNCLFPPYPYIFIILFARKAHLARRMSSSIAISPSSYPSARKDPSVKDDYHGTEVADPYRWLEDPDSKETQDYVTELNKVSQSFINAAQSRNNLSKRLTEMWNYEKFTCTTKRGPYYYYRHNTGLQNQYVLYQQSSLTDKGKVFLDINSLSSDGTTALSSTAFTDDGSIFAYALAEQGSDWTTVKFKKSDGTDLPDVIPRVKFSGLSWLSDNSGIFYSSYPDSKGKCEGTNPNKHEYHSLYFHKMGTDTKDDVLVYTRRDDANIMIDGSVSDDGKYLYLELSRGCDPFNMLYYYDLAAVENKITGPITPTPLFDKLDAKYHFIDEDDTSFLIQTNKDAPMYKLVRVDKQDHSNVTEIVAESVKSKLDWASALPGGRLLVSYLEDVKTALYMHDIETGDRLYSIDLPIGSVSGAFTKKKCNEMFYQFDSHLVPGITYKIDFDNLPKEQKPKSEVLRRVTLPNFNDDDFEVKQVFYESKDKTKVPMFIISKKNLQLNGQNPVLLNGYGGFNVSDTPYFSVSRLMFVKHFGGVVVCANLRGGGEYGEDWHTSGMREKKQNVFDDMQCAAEYLIKQKYTCQQKLAIQGGSNGGLLMGACSQQRPDLFGAVINRVGVLDMLRFHKFTIGGAWVPEFGNPDDANDFKFIYKYSPLHNINFPKGGQWPSTLLMTADHDDRVVPSHTLKYVATLYEKAKQHPDQKLPLLARVEVRAGHGAGKPTAKIIEEWVDIYSFLERCLNLKWID